MKAHLENLTDLPKRQVRSIVAWTLKELEIDRPDLLVRVRPARATQHHGRFYAHARTHWTRIWKGATRARTACTYPQWCLASDYGSCPEQSLGQDRSSVARGATARRSEELDGVVGLHHRPRGASLPRISLSQRRQESLPSNEEGASKGRSESSLRS